MDLNCTIPAPVTLNCWKHHLGFIRRQINKGRREYPDKKRLKELLLVIGESQMDLYSGKLTPRAIATEIIDGLRKLNAGSRILFENWLFGSGKDYKLFTISDSSVWTIRLGKNEKRYVHIHPGRCSVNTLRVKALTLKTAIIAAIYGNRNDYLNLKFINDIRVSILNASPLKSVSGSSGLGKIINILMEEGG